MGDVLTVPEWHADIGTSSKITLVVVDMQELFFNIKGSRCFDSVYY
jgi:hypothetical protein